MKGTEKIIGQITQDAKAQAARILAEAREKSAQIGAEHHARAEQMYREKLDEGKRAQAAQKDSAKRLAGMDGKKEILSAKQEMISQVFSRACEMVESMDDAARTAFYTRLALACCVTGEEEIVLNAKDRAAIGETVVAQVNEKRKASGQTASLTLAADSGAFSGGIILRREGIEVNCTTKLLCEAARADLASEVANILFPA